MPNPNDGYARQMRDDLQAMAENLRKLKKQKSAELSDDDVQKINQAIADTLDKASSLTADAIQDTVENIRNCVCKIDDAKNGLDRALQNLDRVRNIIHIATAVVNLASAASTGNVPEIVSAAGKVMDAAAV